MIFGMSIIFAIAIYFVIWWMTLLAVLPWGVRNTSETNSANVEGHDHGAPVKANIGRKILWTTLVATLIWGIFAANMVYGWVEIKDLPGPNKLY